MYVQCPHLGNWDICTRFFPRQRWHCAFSHICASLNGIEGNVYRDSLLCEMVCARWIGKCSQVQSSKMFPWPYWIIRLLLARLKYMSSWTISRNIPKSAAALHLIHEPFALYPFLRTNLVVTYLSRGFLSWFWPTDDPRITYYKTSYCMKCRLLIQCFWN